MKIHCYWVYILTNVRHTVLYVRVTNDLVGRCFQHKRKMIKGFTKKYNVDKCVYFEAFDFIDLAIKREKQIKGWSRVKKDALIDSLNPDRIDMYDNGKIEIPHSSATSSPIGGIGGRIHSE